NSFFTICNGNSERNCFGCKRKSRQNDPSYGNGNRCRTGTGKTHLKKRKSRVCKAFVSLEYFNHHNVYSRWSIECLPDYSLSRKCVVDSDNFTDFNSDL